MTKRILVHSADNYLTECKMSSTIKESFALNLLAYLGLLGTSQTHSVQYFKEPGFFILAPMCLQIKALPNVKKFLIMVWKNRTDVNTVRPSSFVKQIRLNTWKNIILRVNHPKHEKYAVPIKTECLRPEFQVKGYIRIHIKIFNIDINTALTYIVVNPF